MEKSPNIIWSYSGKTNLVVGTQATTIEKNIGWTAGFIGVIIIGFFYWKNDFDWKTWQYILAGVIAYDVVGGAVANSLNSCKRFYHSSLQKFEPNYVNIAKNHLFFSLIHIHPLIVSLVFSSASWIYGFFWYLILQISVLTVTKTPIYLQRPVSMLIIVTALLINSYFLRYPTGFEWLIPVLFLKIVYGHTVKEEPYRPETEKNI
ncbi:hypothetical protein [Pleurocapsa sp. PCC 7319]|uniref:hypothetical protein n=1 Tax=Pleurocapsa sp. PCC 7319 TaxID=118161 RepID=UPI00034BBD61|nr:hypothetical protein [Pleurocapsa sp. PCC 7319]